MHIAKHTIRIARPREEVFDFFIDFSKASRWRQYVESMQLVGDGPVRVGSRVQTVMHVMGDRYAFELEVLAIERPSLWRHRTFENDFRGSVEYRFEADGAGTRVTLTISATPASAYGWLAVPLMLLRRRQSYVEQLPNLRRVLEEDLLSSPDGLSQTDGGPRASGR